MAYRHLLYNKFHHEPYWKNQQGGISMSEKFKNGWRKVKDGIIIGIAFLPIVLIGVAVATLALIVSAIIAGAFVSICWNIAMPAMFGFSKTTIFQAFVLTFTIGNLRANYYGSAKKEYKKLKEKIFEKCQKEKMAKVVSILLIILFEVIAILIAVFTTMYSWNNILPKLLNVELVQINFLQAIGFGYLFNLLFGHSNDDSKENNKKSDSKNKQPLIKDEFVSKELINMEDYIND